MIKNPYLIICVLLAIEFSILFLADHSRSKKFFRFLPSIFWIYFLPMLASSVGLIDSQSPIYQRIINAILPMSLFLLLIEVDIRIFKKLGLPALLMFAAGSLGITIGVVVTFAVFKNIVGPEYWSGFGSLSASWMGGSANMIAVKEALATPDNIFMPMVVVDTVVPYVWMGMLIALSNFQNVFNRILKANPDVLREIQKKMSAVVLNKEKVFSFPKIALILLLAFAASLLAKRISQLLPAVEGVVTGFTWLIIVISIFGILGSMTKLKNLEKYGTSKIGYYLLFFVLTSIGARATIEHLSDSLILILAGFMIVSIHSLILLLAAKLLRAPFFLAAVSCQANIGGVASAPIVAEIYQPGLSAVGLLLAILGNIWGTYFGIITGQLCRLIAGG